MCFIIASICNGSDSDLDLGGDTGGKKNNNTYIIPVVVGETLCFWDGLAFLEGSPSEFPS